MACTIEPPPSPGPLTRSSRLPCVIHSLITFGDTKQRKEKTQAGNGYKKFQNSNTQKYQVLIKKKLDSGKERDRDRDREMKMKMEIEVDIDIDRERCKGYATTNYTPLLLPFR